MGFKQDMTPEQRSKFESFSYKRMLEERRGHNHSYLTDEKYDALIKKGYQIWDFDGIKETRSESEAEQVRDGLRATGHYASIYSWRQGQIIMREYMVFYRLK